MTRPSASLHTVEIIEGFTLGRSTLDPDTIIIRANSGAMLMMGGGFANRLLSDLTTFMYTESMLDEETAIVLAQQGNFACMSFEDARSAHGLDGDG
jgi:hypothetical protein